MMTPFELENRIRAIEMRLDALTLPKPKMRAFTAREAAEILFDPEYEPVDILRKRDCTRFHVKSIAMNGVELISKDGLEVEDATWEGLLQRYKFASHQPCGVEEPT